MSFQSGGITLSIQIDEATMTAKRIADETNLTRRGLAVIQLLKRTNI